MDSLLPISDPIVLDKVLDILYDDSLIKASSISKYRDSPGCNVQSRLIDTALTIRDIVPIVVLI